MTGPTMRTPAQSKIGAPPVPHEHGAWVMLYAPIVIVAAAFPPPRLAGIMLLTGAVTGIFLARDVLGRVFRKRSTAGDRCWLAVYLLLTAGCAAPLMTPSDRRPLVEIAILAAALFAVHSALLLIPARKRLDRSQWGEVLAVGALSLTAPAASVVVRGGLDAVAWCIWTACTLYFSSSVFFVKMLLAATKYKDGFGLRERWAAGRDCVIYHALLTAVCAFVALQLGGRGGLLSTIAFAPAILRAFAGWLRLSPKLPPLKVVGVFETVYALWFTALYVIAIRAGGS